ncbi:MAG: sialidase family protein [Candidatus Korobacteraceae bacterium]
MNALQSFPGRGVRPVALMLALGLALAITNAVPGHAQTLFRQLSQDTFTNGSSQHMSEVEPGAFASGPTIVTAFQVARIYGGGGADIGWATSLNGGISWTNGYLPGLTEYGPGGGPNSAASDAAVAYDAKHGMWLICTLPIGNYDTVAVSSSSDGIHWNNPVYVIQNRDADKNWIACDDTPTSPYYGNCYVEFDNPDVGDLLYMSTSHDGGQTWSTPVTTGNSDYGIGGNPIVQPNGTVVVPFADFNCGMSAFNSTNGGQSWSGAVEIACAPSHYEAGNLRSAGLPSAAIDGAGTVYASWSDCSFESGCPANDIVYSSSTDGVHWSAKVRIPLDPIGSGVDHFINGMGIDLRTSGSSAHMGMTYYYYPVSNCGNSCTLIAGFSISNNGGTTWTAGRRLSPNMEVSWLPNTFSGYMVADYVATIFPAGGRAFPIYAQAFAPVGDLLQEAIFTSSYGFTQDEMNEPLMSSAGEKPIPGIKSDHPMRTYGELDNEHANHPPSEPNSLHVQK